MNARDILKVFEKMIDSYKNRDLSVGSLYGKIEHKLGLMEYEYPYILDLMTGSDGQYAVFQAGGKLWRTNYTVNVNDEVELDEPFQVKIDYPEVKNSRVMVFRGKDQTLMWIAIASSSVLNRVGEIDSSELFDNFETNFEERDNPYLTLQHLPEEFAFGKVRGVFRLGSLLHAYGDIDEETVLGRYAEENFSSGKWGMSIGFMPTEKPRLLEVDGTNISTYNRGYLVEISALLEERAAAYFTNLINIERVKENRMSVNKDKAKELLLEFVGEENAEQIDELLEESDTRERQIEDDNLITRDTEEKDTTEKIIEVEVEEDEEEVEEDVEFVIDEEVINQIAADVSKRVSESLKPKFDEFDEFKLSVEKDIEEIRTIVSRANEFYEDLSRRTLETDNKVTELEKEDEEKIENAISDLPHASKRKITILHRPTKDNAEGTVEKQSLRAISAETMNKLNVSDRNK